MMSKKSKQPKQTPMYATTATTSENSPARAQPAPSNQLPNCSSYPPPLPAGSPDSVLDALRRAGARIRALEARVLELEKATNDTSLLEKVAAMEAKILDIKRDDTSMKDGREFSNLKTPTRKSCAICSKTFLTNAELEKHMIKKHDASMNFECTVCGKKFFLEWRLKKHTQMHTVIPRACRYFSNNMPCPFEEIGCKFLHAIPLQPATCLVDVHGHEPQPQSKQYQAALQRQEEQPQPQLYHDVHGHAEVQPQHYYLYHAAPE